MQQHIDYFRDVTQNVRQALSEDVGSGDITAELIAAETSAQARVITREDGIVCGQTWVNEVMYQVDPNIALDWLVQDGDSVTVDQALFTLSGSARSLLTAERPALNFLQTLSGTATAAHHHASLIAHTQCKLLDTRKTLPGLRRAQKYAVKCGGGENHRIGLFDAFLIKENHIAACGSIEKAISKARALYPDRKLEIEVENLTEFDEAMANKPDWIMLDNFSLEDMANAVAMRQGNLKLEASGGIESEQALIAIAETGVDYISMGALTKHCKAMDLSMRFVES